MKTALLFPGQGERDVASHLRRALAGEEPLISRAFDAIGWTADRLLRAPGLLHSSRVLQPVLTALSLISAGGPKVRDVQIDLVAGHSLGELAAWAFAGAVSAKDAVDLAALRGRAMSRSAALHPGGMLAVNDLDDAELASVLASARQSGQIWIGAYNSPREIVLTGSRAALQAAAPRCRSRRLAVEGAWHSPLMEEAKQAFAAALQTSAFRQGPAAHLIPVVSGCDGACLRDPQEMGPRLTALMTQPLHWTSVMCTLSTMGVERFVIAGPGRILRYLIRRNLPSADVVML